MSKKIIFLVKSEKTPSSRIRVRDLLPYLEEKGLDIEIENIPKSFLARRKLFKKCADFDLTVFQKRLFSRFDFNMLRKNARKLAFDFDDAVFLRNAAPSEDESDYVSPTRRRRFRRILRKCDFVIAANQYLADEAEKLVPDTIVHIIPSSVDSDNIKAKDSYKLSSPPVIGWVGTKVNQRYIEFISSQLCELRDKRELILHVISDRELYISGLDIKNVEVNFSDDWYVPPPKKAELHFNGDGLDMLPGKVEFSDDWYVPPPKKAELYSNDDGLDMLPGKVEFFDDDDDLDMLPGKVEFSDSLKTKSANNELSDLPEKVNFTDDSDLTGSNDNDTAKI